MVSLEDMPPLEEPQPSAEERERFVAWVEGHLESQGLGVSASRAQLPRFGNRLNHDDLFRCQADKARCAVIMSNKFCQSHQTEDYKNILSAFAIKKFVKQLVPKKEMRICL